MKRTIEHLAPYLPYGLKGMLIHDLRDDFMENEWVEDIEIFNKGTIWQYAGYADEDLCIPLGDGDFSGFLIKNNKTYTSVGNSVKPILRPLSDLKKDEYYDNLCYSSKTLIIREDLHYNWVESIPHFDFKKLIEWHFDVFGLIEKGLAININTIES